MSIYSSAALYLVLVVAPFPTLAQRAPAQTHNGITLLATPVNQIDPVKDTSPPEERAARSSSYNSPVAFQNQLRDLDVAPESSNQEHFHVFIDRRPVPRIPSALSDMIAVGTVDSFQPYLSQDHTSIYSELKFQPEKIIKDENSLKQKAITILQGGGTLRLANGRVESVGPAMGSSPIDIGKRYLLFLKFSSLNRAYTVVKAWDLSNSVPVELSANGKPMERRSVNDPYDVSSQESLLAAVSEDISK